MAAIPELYTAVYEKLRAVSARWEDAAAQLDESRSRDEAARLKRIENLRTQLESIDGYMEKVEAFRLLAEKHMTSKNLLAITPRELNFNRLRNWAMMIDPSEPDDPYAKRIYVQTKCNEMFLQKKKAEFTRTLAELESDDGAEADAELARAVARAQELCVADCQAILDSADFAALAALTATSAARSEALAEKPALRTEADGCAEKVGLGVYAMPLPVLPQLRFLAKAKLGERYDERGYVLLPVEHAPDREMLLSVGCVAAKEKKLRLGLQRYLLDLICAEPVGTRKIVFLDALHFNATALGLLRPLEDSAVLEAVPKDAEAIEDKLREIVSGFSDIDEALGMADSVADYNASASPAERLQRTVLVLFGYPSAFSAEARGRIRRILLNYAHYGVSPILIDTQPGARRDGEDAAMDLAENVYRVRMTQQNELIRQDQGTERFFRWHAPAQELPQRFVDDVRSYDESRSGPVTEYIKRVSGMTAEYTRGNKSLTLLYCASARDEDAFISFDNENFAAFLMGASGSGKSTLLHTLITSILLHYHPDDVELWLADFKMSEFAQYVDPMPPHVKYILLDESPELVYDLIDRLTDEMMARQRFFMRHREYKKVENVPKDVYMPVIFVILDEFSIMSQAVAESEVYKLRLQNLLAKGRALGIKFLFSSQTFTKGVSGLTQTAKDQIQTRIAMKNSYDEINQTLELTSGSRTEQVKGWMDALPPHFTLMKYRDGDVMRVRRDQVLYFKGSGEAALEPQRSLVRGLRSMRPVPLAEYGAGPDTYVDKQPVVVDGNSYDAFNGKKLAAELADFRAANADELSQDDVVVCFGTPRRMNRAEYAVFSPESRENLLLIARGAEQACAMSLLLTAMKSFAAQGARVRVWAYGKNRLFRAYRDSLFAQYEIAEGLDAVCDAIREERRAIASGESESGLIVLLGMEQICGDFELIDFGGASASGAARAETVDAKKYMASTEEEMRKYLEVKDLSERFREQYGLDALEDQWLDEGKSLEDITREEDRLYDEFLRGLGLSPAASVPAGTDAPVGPPSPEPDPDPAPTGGAYNAAEDFKYIVRQGSRFGRHFLLCLNDLSDLRAVKLQQELFRHKLVFQIPAEDALTLFASRAASRLPEHICQYSNSLEQYSLRPFLHEGVGWDGWDVDENGEAVSGLL